MTPFDPTHQQNHQHPKKTGKDESLLPANYRFYETSMPPAPPGCDWSFDIQKQSWFARNRTNMGQVVGELQDGYRYLLMVKYLPAGWELG